MVALLRWLAVVANAAALVLDCVWIGMFGWDYVDGPFALAVITISTTLGVAAWKLFTRDRIRVLEYAAARAAALKRLETVTPGAASLSGPLVLEAAVLNPVAGRVALIGGAAAAAGYIVFYSAIGFWNDRDLPVFLLATVGPAVLTALASFVAYRQDTMSHLRRRLREASLEAKVREMERELGLPTSAPDTTPPGLVGRARMEVRAVEQAVDPSCQTNREAPPQVVAQAPGPTPVDPGSRMVHAPSPPAGAFFPTARQTMLLASLGIGLASPSIALRTWAAALDGGSTDSPTAGAVYALMMLSTGITGSMIAATVSILGLAWVTSLSVRPRVALSAGFCRAPSVYLVGLVAMLASVAGLALLVVPGLIIAAGLWMAVPAFLVDPKDGVIGGLRRSWSISKGRRPRVFLVLVAATAAAAVFGWLLSGPTEAAVAEGRWWIAAVTATGEAALSGVLAVVPALLYARLRKDAATGGVPLQAEDVLEKALGSGRRQDTVAGVTAMALIIVSTVAGFVYLRGPSSSKVCERVASKSTVGTNDAAFVLWGARGPTGDIDEYVVACASRIDEMRSAPRSPLQKLVHQMSVAAAGGRNEWWRGVVPAWIEVGLDARCVLDAPSLDAMHACSCDLTATIFEQHSCRRGFAESADDKAVVTRYLAFASSHDIDSALQLVSPEAALAASAFFGSLTQLAQVFETDVAWDTHVNLLLRSLGAGSWDRECLPMEGEPSRCTWSVDAVPLVSVGREEKRWLIDDVMAAPLDTEFLEGVGACVQLVEGEWQSSTVKYVRDMRVNFNRCVGAVRSAWAERVRDRPRSAFTRGRR